MILIKAPLDIKNKNPLEVAKEGGLLNQLFIQQTVLLLDILPQDLVVSYSILGSGVQPDLVD